MENRITLQAGDYVYLPAKNVDLFNKIVDAFKNARGSCQVDSRSSNRKAVYWTSYERNLTSDQVLNATNAQPPAPCIKVDDVPEWECEEGYGCEIHNDDRYTLLYGHDVIGSNGVIKAVYWSGGIKTVAVEVDGNGYCFRADMIRPITPERDKVIELVADFLNCGPYSRDNLHAKEIATALADKDMLKVPEEG